MRKLARMAPLAMATSCALAYAGPSRAGSAMAGELAQGRAESWWVRQIKEFRTYPHLDRSYRLIKDGLYAAASSELAKYLDLAPEDFHARTLLASVQYKLKDYKGAIQEANTVLEANPGEYSAVLYRGLSEQALGDLQAAAADFSVVANNQEATGAEREFALSALADAAAELSRFAEAREALVQLILAHPDAPNFLRLGYIDERSGDAAEAEQSYQHVLQLPCEAPQRAQALLGLARLAYRVNHDTGLATSFLEAAIAIEPANGEALRWLAELAYAGKDYGRATAWASRVVSVDPSPRNVQFLANSQFAQHDYEAAAANYGALLQKLQNADRRYEVFMALGYTQSALGRQQEAAEAFLGADISRQDGGAALAAAARAYEQAGDLPAAIQTLERAEGRRPTAEREFALGMLCAKAGQEEAVRRWLTMAVRGPLPRKDAKQAYMQLGYIYSDRADPANAELMLRRALDLDRGDRTTYEALAETLVRRGEAAQAVAYGRQAVAQLPTARAWGTLRDAYAMLGQWDLAADALEHWMLLSKPSAEGAASAQAQLAQFYVNGGRREEAAAALQKSVTLSGSHADRYEALGNVLFALDRPREALTAFEQSWQLGGTPVSLVHIARCYVALNDRATAVRYIHRALDTTAVPAGTSPAAAGLTESDRKQLYEEVAYLYAAEGAYGESAAAFEQSLSTGYSAGTAFRAGRMRRMAGQPEDAIKILSGIDPQRLREEDRSAWLDELVESYRDVNRPDLATATLLRAIDGGMDDPQTRRRLGFALYEQGRWPEALTEFQRALEQQRDAGTLVNVARCYERLNKGGLAIYYIRQALEESRSRDAADQSQLRDELASLLAEEGEYAQAAEVWEQALGQRQQPSPAALLRLARAQRLAGDAASALDTLRRQDVESLSDAQVGDWLAELAQAYRGVGDDELAAGALGKAVALGPSPARYYDLGNLLLALHRPANAVDALSNAAALDPGNVAYVQALGYAQMANRQYADAAGAFEKVLKAAPRRAELYADAAYAHQHAGDNDAASRWFRRAIDSELAAAANASSSPRVAGRPASTPAIGSIGSGTRASTLAEHNPLLKTNWSPSQDVRPVQPAQADDAGAPQAAHSDDGGSSQVGQFDYAQPLRLARLDKAQPLQPAQSDDAGPIQPAQPDDARSLLLVQPDDAGRLRLGQSGDGAGAGDQGTSDQDSADKIYGLQQANRELNRRLDLTLYQSYHAGANNTGVAPSVTTGGVLPSQGGAELSFQPPVIGYRDGRIFQIFTRALWTNKPHSLAIEGDSMQGGVGVRYKPLQEQNLFVGAERLVKIGSESEDSWLFRASYSWSLGTELRAPATNRNYTLLYGDAGYFTNGGISAFYGEARQGRTFRGGSDALLITPHVVIDGRVQRPDPESVSYLEAGAGISTKYLFNYDRYQGYRADAELLVQYKAGLHRVGSGWVITAVLHF